MDETDKRKLNTVHERDLDTLLGKMGAKEDFDSGKKNCKFCGKQITNENLYSILPQSGAINMICDDPECITSLTEYLDERKKKL